MLSAWNRLKQVPGLKTPKLFSPLSFDLGVSNYQFVHTNHITSTRAKFPWIYSTLSSFPYKNRSLVTQTFIKDEEEQLAYQVLDVIVSELQKNQTSVKELCTNHINQLCKKKKLRAAARLLKFLRDKYAINSLPSYNLILDAACENNDIETVSRIFKDMLINHLSMNSTTYFNVAKAISKSNNLTLVLSFVKEISELTFTGSVMVINRIIYAFANCGQVHNAMLVFDNMKSLKSKPDLITYNTVLGILGKAGRVEEMLNLLTSMKKVNIAPDIFSYNTLLHSLRKVGRFDLCVVLTKEMGKLGLQPDLITYTALIECFFRSGNIEESLRFFEEMKRGHIRPSIYIYRSLISNLKRLGKLELALKFSEEMNECREDLVGPKDFKRRKDRNISFI